MDLIKLGTNLAKVPIFRDIFLWYAKKSIRDGTLTTDDFVNYAVAGGVERCERASDEELEKWLDFIRKRDSEAYRDIYKKSVKRFPSREALDQYLDQMIPEIERILFLREHRRRYHPGGQID